MVYRTNDLDLRLLNSQEMTLSRHVVGDQAEWHRFAQQKGWLPHMLRVCGTQKEVDAMKHSHSFSASSLTLFKQSGSLMGSAMLVTVLALVLVCL